MPHLSGRELEYIEKAMEGSWVVPLGPDVDAFERELAGFLGVEGDRVVALSSGTAAIHLGLEGCGVKAGDEVIVQSMTFSASANPVRYLGATPVFVDSEEETWNIDPALLERAILDRETKTGRRPKAIVPVSLYGMPPRMAEILEVAQRHGIPVMEDAAEGLGSSYGGRRLGTLGRYGALSFNGNKMITTSGGGALICPDAESRRRALFLATQAREDWPFYQHEEIGYNYRLSNISAAIGRGQLTVVEEHIAHHRHVQALYRELLAGVEVITLHENLGPAFDSNFWLCTILLDTRLRVKGEGEVKWPAGNVATPGANVEAMRRRLAAEDIESRPLWKPMHLQPVFAGCPSYVNGVSESLFSRGLCLPAGPWVGDAEVERVAAAIAGSLEK